MSQFMITSNSVNQTVNSWRNEIFKILQIILAKELFLKKYYQKCSSIMRALFSVNLGLKQNHKSKGLFCEFSSSWIFKLQQIEASLFGDKIPRILAIHNYKFTFRRAKKKRQLRKAHIFLSNIEILSGGSACNKIIFFYIFFLSFSLSFASTQPKR